MMSSTGILTIDLPAIQANWRYVANFLVAAKAMPAECAAVVKADAYGVGAIEVASALYLAGCRYFFVVTFNEAAQLRRALPQDAILYVLGGVKSGAEPQFIALNLIPVLYSLLDVERWLAFCAASQCAHACVIKIDTGMTRLGLSTQDLQQLMATIKLQSWFNPVLLMSHLACADEPSHPLNGLQLQRFILAVAAMRRLFPTIKSSLANSSGTFLSADYHFDMVRVGAALYGINPQVTLANPLQDVIHLTLPVLQIRTTVEPVSVGYGATTQVAAATRLAVVAGGYADGVHRCLGLSPKAMVGDQLIFAVGRISMDSLVFDISSLDGNPEYITVINHKLTLDVLMQQNKSLGYEVLTSLGRRYQRQYLPPLLQGGL